MELKNLKRISTFLAETKSLASKVAHLSLFSKKVNHKPVDISIKMLREYLRQRGKKRLNTVDVISITG